MGVSARQEGRQQTRAKRRRRSRSAPERSARLAASLHSIATLLPVKHMANLAIATTTVALSLLVVELALAFVEGDDKRSDARTTIQVIEDLNEAGTEAFPVVVPTEFLQEPLETSGGNLIFPLSGIANVSTVWCNESGEWVVYESDEHGFNNPKGIWGKEAIDVAAIGDSFTHGACVEPEKNAMGLIREVYDNTLNLGIGGSGPWVEFATLKEYLGDLKPRVVLWFYTEGNDLGNLAWEKQAHKLFWEGLRSNQPQGLASMQADIDDSLRAYVNKRREEVSSTEASSREPALVGSVVDRLSLQTIRGRTADLIPGGAACVAKTYDWAPFLEEFGRILASADEYVDTWGGQLYFVYLPTWVRYADSYDKCALNKAASHVTQHDQVLSLAENSGLPVIDVTKAFDAHADALSLWPFRGNAHYNEQGYALVAEAVLQSIPAEAFARANGEFTRPYRPGSIVPVGSPTVVPSSLQAGQTAEIRWTVRNDGDRKQYAFLLFGPAPDIAYTPKSASLINAGETMELTTQMFVSLPPGTQPLEISIGNTQFTETLTLTVLPPTS